MKKTLFLFFCIEIIVVIMIFAKYFKRNSLEIAFVDDQMNSFLDEKYNYITTPSIELEKGVYFVEVDYCSEDDSSTSDVYIDGMTETSINYNWIKTDKVNLYSYKNHIDYRLYVEHCCCNIMVRNAIKLGKHLDIKKVLIRYIPLKSACYNALKVALIFFVIDCAWIIAVDIRKGRVRIEILIILFISLLSSMPLTIPFLIPGHDVNFHIIRFAGIADGLIDGNIPVRCQSIWLNGYGAATGVTYPDFFMYPFAALYALGVPLYFVYKLYMLVVNFATASISYYSFYKISNKRDVALAATTLYSLSMWRLIDLYTRQALGEYTALIFLPMVILGIYEIYYQKPGYHFAFGMSGIILSHPLTVLITAEFIFVFFLLNYKKLFTLKIIINICRQCLLILLFNIWIIVPLLEYYMFEGIGVSATNRNIQGHGIYLSQLFSLEYDVSSYSKLYSASQEMPLTIGVSTTAIYLISIVALTVGGFKSKEILRKVFIIGIISLMMSSAYFPYSWLMEHCETFYHILASIQFPWRYLSIATIIAIVLFVLMYGESDCLMKKNINISKVLYFLIFITLIQGIIYMSDSVNCKSNPFTCLSEGAVNSFGDVGNFILSYVNREDCKDTSILLYSEDIEVTVLEKDGTRYKLFIDNESKQEESVDLPIMGYRQYAVDNQLINTAKGENKRLRLIVPASFVGEVNVSYKEPILWRVCEFISVISLAIYTISKQFFKLRTTYS